MGDILFLAHRAPFPPDRGDKIRAYNILKYLAARRRVHLVAFADDERDLTPDAALRALVGECRVVRRTKPQWRAGIEALATRRPVSLTAFADEALADAVRGILAQHPIETIYVFSSQMAQYLPDDRRQRVVMDFCDMDSAKFAQYAEESDPLRGAIMRREARLLLAHDRAVAARADASLFVSDAEAALFECATGADNVRTVGNGIDMVGFDPAAAFAPIDAGSELIAFTGQMDYAPNIEAVAWFAETVLPLVRARHPDAQFAIVGRNPTKAVRALSQLPGVKVTGEVADVRGWLAAAAVVVAPLKLARGVQNKVLEAMAMARPVVASTAAAEGIDHGGTIRIGSDAATLAEAVIAVLADRPTAEAQGQAARARVIARYGWDAQLAPLDAIIGLGAPSQYVRSAA